MIEIEDLENLAKKREKNNYKFRTYLKNHAMPDELDMQFKELHDKYFSMYDCAKCRNCCKKYRGTIPFEDVEKDAEYLGMSTASLKEKYLCEEANYEGYNTKSVPCDFFVDDKCILCDDKPQNCKEFPYTDKEDRIGSLLGIVEYTFVCPVVYEIMEELKTSYGFR